MHESNTDICIFHQTTGLIDKTQILNLHLIDPDEIPLRKKLCGNTHLAGIDPVILTEYHKQTEGGDIWSSRNGYSDLEYKWWDGKKGSKNERAVGYPMGQLVIMLSNIDAKAPMDALKYACEVSLQKDSEANTNASVVDKSFKENKGFSWQAERRAKGSGRPYLTTVHYRLVNEREFAKYVNIKMYKKGDYRDDHDEVPGRNTKRARTTEEAGEANSSHTQTAPPAKRPFPQRT
jgi:hypothetical protein